MYKINSQSIGFEIKNSGGIQDMKNFRITFTIDGRRTEQIVRAHSLMEAKNIVKAQFPGHNIRFISTGHEYM